ncbi:MAG: HAD-IA family hydrolase [Arthrobacter sp.]|uniref:HAD-IA family hydrolase n=1 Tax=Arthrobacter sp. TaxID=1667 RepID=UPI00348057F1
MTTTPAPDSQAPVHLDVDALLFDLDGTLIDSTEPTERAWNRWGREMGLEDFRYTAHGIPARSIVADHIEPERRDEALRRINELEAADTGGIHRTPGAERVLASLPAGRWTIVTSCTADLAAARMASAGVAAPPLMVTAEQVDAGKPDPEGYLLGARRIGADIRRCLVIEDAPAGVEAGRASGAVTLAVSGTFGADALPATHVVDSLERVEVSELPSGRLRVTLLPARDGASAQRGTSA